MSTLEFVVYDKHGNEVDSIDPYHGHVQVTPGQFLVTGQSGYEYQVFLPEGGRFETRLREDS